MPTAADNIVATAGKKGLVPMSDLSEILESLVRILLHGSGA